jgi:hypothetical protein
MGKWAGAMPTCSYFDSILFELAAKNFTGRILVRTPLIYKCPSTRKKIEKGHGFRVHDPSSSRRMSLLIDKTRGHAARNKNLARKFFAPKNILHG